MLSTVLTPFWSWAMHVLVGRLHNGCSGKVAVVRLQAHLASDFRERVDEQCCVVQVNSAVRRANQAATLAKLTDFHGEREQCGVARPSMLDLPQEVWQAMVANSKRIVWPGHAPKCIKQVIINEHGEEEVVTAGHEDGKAPSKAAILNAAIRCAYCPLHLLPSTPTASAHRHE
jgi:hypothetical protein